MSDEKYCNYMFYLKLTLAISCNNMRLREHYLNLNNQFSFFIKISRILIISS